MMKHRFLIHQLNHTYLLVDITQIGLPVEVYPPEGRSQSIPSLRFQGWQHAEQHLLDLGANQEALNGIKNELRFTSIAVLTITV
jgi:hypothetical protein